MSMAWHMEKLAQAQAMRAHRRLTKVAAPNSVALKRFGELAVGAGLGGGIAFATHGERPRESLITDTLIGAGAGASLAGVGGMLARRAAVGRFRNPKAYQDALKQKVEEVVDARAAQVRRSALAKQSPLKRLEADLSGKAEQVRLRLGRAQTAADTHGANFDTLRGGTAVRDKWVDLLAARDAPPGGVLHGLQGGFKGIDKRVRENAKPLQAVRDHLDTLYATPAGRRDAAWAEEVSHYEAAKGYHEQVIEELQRFKAQAGQAFQATQGTVKRKLVGAREAVGTAQQHLKGTQALKAQAHKRLQEALAEADARQVAFDRLKARPKDALAEGSFIPEDVRAKIQAYAERVKGKSEVEAVRRSKDTFFGFGG